MPSPHRFQAHHHFPKPREDPCALRSCRQTPKAFGVNFREPVLKNGIFRMILPGANQKAENEDPKFRFRTNLNLCSIRCFLLDLATRRAKCLWAVRLRCSLLIPRPRDGHTRGSRLPPTANPYCAARLGILTGSLILGLGASLRHFG